jgi:hypothetical protein
VELASVIPHGSGRAGSVGATAARPGPASVSARIAATGLLEHPSSKATLDPGRSPNKEPRFPGEDGGRSLAEMADGDLDAALQLLADRAQYITGASGAAIALRRGEHSDMLCRASAGACAPELGAILSMEYGLSGESVRTGRALRCDDAESDARVNRQVCRRLGIASVVVMPIVSERQILGVFELFSGKPRAFDERDLAALQRLSEMVETAIQHAVAAQKKLPAVDSVIAQPLQPPTPIPNRIAAPVESHARINLEAAAIPTPAVNVDASGTPLLWSAAIRTQRGAPATDDRISPAAESVPVPPMLRKLQKCQACGFPVSSGRTFCVECEEKHWRGEQLPQPACVVRDASHGETVPAEDLSAAAAVFLKPSLSLSLQSISVRVSSESPVAPTHVGSGTEPKLSAAAPALLEPAQSLILASAEPAAEVAPVESTVDKTVDGADSEIPAPFFASAVSSESWFAAHKYILAALIVVAIVVGAFAYLR